MSQKISWKIRSPTQGSTVLHATRPTRQRLDQNITTKLQQIQCHAPVGLLAIGKMPDAGTVRRRVPTSAHTSLLSPANKEGACECKKAKILEWGAFVAKKCKVNGYGMPAYGTPRQKQTQMRPLTLFTPNNEIVLARYIVMNFFPNILLTNNTFRRCVYKSENWYFSGKSTWKFQQCTRLQEMLKFNLF